VRPLIVVSRRADRNSMDLFEKARLHGTPPTTIELQTRLGRSVANIVEVEPGDREQRLWKRQEEVHPHWERRRPPCGGHNCAGLVWASRRTGIFEIEGWLAILHDDGYRELGLSEVPERGDLVLYRDPQAGYLHVGLVLSIEQGLSRESRQIARVLSKFNSVSGEYIHWEHDHPFQNFSVTIEHWTDRPLG
jgi:hypothetical protein